MADDWFDDDPFDSIVREFFGERPRRYRRESIIRNEEDERTIDFIETDDKIYLIFEIPGYSKEDVEVEVDNKSIVVKAKKTNFENVKDYLSQKLSSGIYYKRSLPEEANPKRFHINVKNGILEVAFEKK